MLSRWAALLLVVLIVKKGLWAAETEASSAPPRTAVVIADLIRLFPEASVEQAVNPSAKESETCGGVSLPGIFLHPRDEGEATILYPPVDLPPLEPHGRTVLALAVGVRDGVPFGAVEAPRFDGVRFTVAIDGEVRVTREVFDAGWKWIAVDLSDQGGNPVAISFSVHRVGDTNYDWAVIGAPTVLGLKDPWEPPGPAGEIESWDPKSGSIVVSGSEYLFPPRLEIGDPYLSRVLAEEGKPVTFLVPIRNTGRGFYRESQAATVRLEVVRLETGTVRALTPMALPEVPPGGETVLAWKGFVVEAAGNFRIRAEATGDAFAVGTAAAEFRSVSWMAGTEASVQSDTARIDVVVQQDKAGFAHLRVRPRGDAEWAAVGRMFPLAEIAVARRGSGNIHHERIEFPAARLTFIPGRFVKLRRDVEWSEGKGLTELAFLLDTKTGLIRYDLAARFEEAVDIYKLAGPRLAVGEGSFGSDHDIALFPGLEYFGSEDHSSSLLDAVYPLNLRRVPHPRKVTIPLMSIQRGDFLVAMMWDPFAPWAGEKDRLSAHFDVPPKATGLDYSEMRLFAPSVPDCVPEHRFEARRPYPLAIQQPAQVGGWIYLEHRNRGGRPRITDQDLPGEFSLAALQRYVQVFGLPDPMRRRYSWEEQKALCRKAWLDTIWVPEEKGWRHANGEAWNPFPAPGYMLLLLLDAYDTDDPATDRLLLDRVKTAYAEALARGGPGILSAGTNCHILWGEAPFLLGNVSESLDRWIEEGQRLITSQAENGGWGWNPNPSRPKTQDLGAPGEQQSGTIASGAYRLLKLARVTGDVRFRDAGLRALERMEQFRIPRGAQGWEVPLHCADILAAGYAVRANVEACKITGDGRYLDQARYWAWAGLPFVYLWNEPDIPSMRYNAIPVFGATHYVGSWFGVPVVWCGLLYAYGLQELAPLDGSFPWMTVAEGITRSAEWQQYEAEHPSAGCYPDSYNLMNNQRNPVDINPEGILVNAFALEGLDPGLITHLLPFRGLETRLSGVLYDVESHPPLTIVPKLPPGAVAFFSLSPVKDIESITFAGERLDQPASLEEIGQGYQLDPRRRRLVIKVTVEKGSDNRLVLR